MSALPQPAPALAPSPTPFQPTDKGKSTKAASWTIKATKLPILNIPDADQSVFPLTRPNPHIDSRADGLPNPRLRRASAELGIPLPEICFGRNSLRLEDEQSGLVLEWDTMGALRGVEVGTEGGVKVAHAKEWARG